LGRVLADLMPDEDEVVGLLALMLLHDARRPTRVDDDGELVLLADQDRARWDRDRIAEGVALLERALRRSAAGAGVGPYQLEAAIVAVHAEAPDASSTDWPQIAALYGQLARVAPNPVVELNRAVAVSMADGPAAGLAVLDGPEVAAALVQHHRYHLARADLLARLGRPGEAAGAYRAALALDMPAAERRHLERKLRETERIEREEP
jgi:RNA polymerase sigma-70 factor (ECF subfamily)